MIVLNKLKQNKIIILLVILTIIRLLMSLDLPVYYIRNLRYDDVLMIDLADAFKIGNYLGEYSNVTLIKGIIYPLFLSFCQFFKLSYSLILTIFYILSCIYFGTSLNKVVKNKKIVIVVYLVLLFNPISYSMELFQRIYRNALSLGETLLFFGLIIRLVACNETKNNVINYLLLGLITSIMLLTREDSMWAFVTIIVLIIYKVLVNKNIKAFLLSLLPIIGIIINLNIVSLINYHYYGIYTYNEISNSEFSKAYLKIQEIKDDNEETRYSITKDTFYKLADLSDKFDITRKDIDNLYKSWPDDNGEINNGNIIWAFRHLIYSNKKFKDGKSANLYFKELSEDVERLFEEGKLEREKVIPSVLINTPSKKDILNLPKEYLKTLKYVTTYQNIKSIDKNTIEQNSKFFYEFKKDCYYTFVKDYHNAENIISKNIKGIEIIRNVYKYLTIVLSFVSLIIFIKNIKLVFKEQKYFVILLILVSYFVITMGVTYTNLTAFHAIRYFYLGPVYLLQNIFIILTLEGIDYEGIKINYLNALFKRRKNIKKVSC